MLVDTQTRRVANASDSAEEWETHWQQQRSSLWTTLFALPAVDSGTIGCALFRSVFSSHRPVCGMWLRLVGNKLPVAE